MTTISKNLGGDRLGSGNKMNVDLHPFQRSTHDLSYIWRSSMTTGTLVPFCTELMLPGDTFDVELGAIGNTAPTLAPLFGSFKLQLDMFFAPIRLYQSALHQNLLNIGMDMSQIKFHQIKFEAPTLDVSVNDILPLQVQQINPSSIFSYLGIRSAGAGLKTGINRSFNAHTYLAYWDIFKNYYSNKMEEYAYVIHNTSPTIRLPYTFPIDWYRIGDQNPVVSWDGIPWDPVRFTNLNYVLFPVNSLYTTMPDPSKFMVTVEFYESTPGGSVLQTVIEPLTKYFNKFDKVKLQDNNYYYKFSEFNDYLGYQGEPQFTNVGYTEFKADNKVSLEKFKLTNIDDMRTWILSCPPNTIRSISHGAESKPPYTLPFQEYYDSSLPPLLPQSHTRKCYFGQMEGLALKTYQSDMFNNWVSKSYVNSVTSQSMVSTSSGQFSIDSLNLAQKIYNLLNRIAVSGGSYQDWIEAAYSQKDYFKTEVPVYLGGLSKEIIFNEVISTSSTEGAALGAITSKGSIGSKHKGGTVIAKANEIGYLIGIVSITPRLDYSQGNKWHNNLKNINELHKPSLNGIGFQDLVTDSFAAFSTKNTESSTIYKSVGKQPAWINYTTNVNQCFGNFADPRNQMFMTLNRKYSAKWANDIPTDIPSDYDIDVQDPTTYIDPSLFNNRFAYEDLSAQNFWIQIAVNIEARRKVSARQIPNL